MLSTSRRGGWAHPPCGPRDRPPMVLISGRSPQRVERGAGRRSFASSFQCISLVERTGEQTSIYPFLPMWPSDTWHLSSSRRRRMEISRETMRWRQKCAWPARVDLPSVDAALELPPARVGCPLCVYARVSSCQSVGVCVYPSRRLPSFPFPFRLSSHSSQP